MFSIGVRYTSVVNVVNSYIGTFDLTISRTQTDETEHTIRDFLTNVAKYDTVEDFSRNVLHNMQRTSSRNGILKAEACREIALVCRKHGINSCATSMTIRIRPPLIRTSSRCVAKAAASC